MRRRHLRVPVAILRHCCLTTAWSLILIGLSGFWVTITAVYPIQRTLTQLIATSTCGEIMFEAVQGSRKLTPAWFDVSRNSGTWSLWHWPIYQDSQWPGGPMRTRTLIFPIWMPILVLLLSARWLNQLRKWIVHLGHCECGYSLEGLTRGLCPECGALIATRKSPAA